MQKLDSVIKRISLGENRTYDLETTTHEASFKGLPDGLKGATFVHLSDFHCGFARLESVYEEILAQTNALQPDYIFFTGDFVDKRHGTSAYPIVELLSRFKAKQGVFGSYGNHDQRRGIPETRKYLEKAGIEILCNESRQLESGLWVAGVDDLGEGKPDIPATFKNLPEDKTSLVLSHNPRLIEKAGGRDLLILSGHTHGGQVAPNPLTAFLICYLHHHCWEVGGWYRKGRTRLYVNRGAGMTGKPYRINCPAEIGVFQFAKEGEPKSSASNVSANARELASR